MTRFLAITLHWLIFVALLAVFLSGCMLLYRRDVYNTCVNKTMPYYLDTTRCHNEVYGEN